MLGELLASQLNNYIGIYILNVSDSNQQSYSGNTEVGKYLKDKIFFPGSKYHWSELIKKATNENLNPIHYANQFINHDN